MTNICLEIRNTEKEDWFILQRGMNMNIHSPFLELMRLMSLLPKPCSSLSLSHCLVSTSNCEATQSLCNRCCAFCSRSHEGGREESVVVHNWVRVLSLSVLLLSFNFQENTFRVSSASTAKVRRKDLQKINIPDCTLLLSKNSVTEKGSQRRVSQSVSPSLSIGLILLPKTCYPTRDGWTCLH